MANPKGGRPRGRQPDPKVIEREQEVLKLRRGGLTWDLIGERLGIHLTTARAAYERALTRVVKEDVDAIRALETERLDLAQSAIWGKVLQGDNPSITNLLRIMERRARLLGLDQPTRIQAEVITYDANSIQAELARIYHAHAEPADSGAQVQVGSATSEVESVTTGE
jgi:DNA-binding CsgD family transcriptional regulator